METLTTPTQAVTKLRGFVRGVVEGRYGFIRTDDHVDYFFHHNDVLPKGRKNIADLKGRTVEFLPVKNTAVSKSDRAINVEVIS